MPGKIRSVPPNDDSKGACRTLYLGTVPRSPLSQKTSLSWWVNLTLGTAHHHPTPASSNHNWNFGRCALAPSRSLRQGEGSSVVEGRPAVRDGTFKDIMGTVEPAVRVCPRSAFPTADPHPARTDSRKRQVSTNAKRDPALRRVRRNSPPIPPRSPLCLDPARR